VREVVEEEQKEEEQKFDSGLAGVPPPDAETS